MSCHITKSMYRKITKEGLQIIISNKYNMENKDCNCNNAGGTERSGH